MGRILKYIVIVPCYIFLVVKGFIGGTAKKKDAWDDLVNWAKK